MPQTAAGNTVILAVPAFISATLGLAVYVLGAMLNARFKILRHFNLPDPVSGGLLAAILVLILFIVFGVSLEFDMQTRDFLLALTSCMILAENLSGVAGALLFGSATLTGGHGTAIAWSPEVAAAAGLDNAQELGVAVTSLGLVIAALIGGLIANYLVEGRNLSPDRPEEGPIGGVSHDPRAENDGITPISVARVLLYLNLSIIAGFLVSLAIDAAGVKLPLFVPCLIMGILIANLRSFIAPGAAPVSRTPALALISEISLGTFLAMSLMSLQLWTLVNLGGPIFTILAVQSAMTIAFVLFVLFPLMGGGYRAAVLGAGFGGFALGATPTAIANMTAVTKRYGPSPMAFLILPLVSAFFVDIANAIVIQFVVNL